MDRTDLCGIGAMMELDQARAFLRENHRAVLATHHADGRLQLSPVTCGVDVVGRVVISTRETAAKTKNLTRDPRAVICVMTDAFFGPWIQLEGEAEIVRQPEAMDLLIDYYRDITGEHPNWDDYRAAMKREQRVLIRINIDRAGPDKHG
jgi:PPOX class probable F420-dependent enzyme